MPTVYTGRSPISFTVSNYNQGNWGDSEPWDGMTRYNTLYKERIPPITNTVMPVLEIGYWDDTKLWNDTLLWSDIGLFGSSWNWRITT